MFFPLLSSLLRFYIFPFLIDAKLFIFCLYFIVFYILSSILDFYFSLHWKLPSTLPYSYSSFRLDFFPSPLPTSPANISFHFEILVITSSFFFSISIHSSSESSAFVMRLNTSSYFLIKHDWFCYAQAFFFLSRKLLHHFLLVSPFL